MPVEHVASGFARLTKVENVPDGEIAAYVALKGKGAAQTVALLKVEHGAFDNNHHIVSGFWSTDFFAHVREVIREVEERCLKKNKDLYATGEGGIKTIILKYQ